MKCCAVIIDNTVRSFDKIYNYLVPAEYESRLETGMRISVPFGKGNNVRLGYFVDFIECENKEKLKSIIDIIDEESIITKDMFRLAKFIRDKYFCTYGQALNLMIPSGMKIKREKYVTFPDGKKIPFNEFLKQLEGDFNKLNKLIDENKIHIIDENVKNANAKYLQYVSLNISHEEASEILGAGELSNEKHVKTLELLLEFEEIAVSDLESYENISRAVIKTLAGKGLLKTYKKEVERKSVNMEYNDEPIPESLTSEQQFAVDTIEESLKNSCYRKYLIHGVTGSGKTEVYMQLAKKTLDRGKEVIVLVPEISLTPLMIRRFSNRFGDNVAVIHSRLSMGERYDQWNKIKKGEAKIALGARSCIFAPFKNLGLVIIDEEHEPSYKSENTPKYDARDVADKRCKLSDSVLVLGSATPSVETYALLDNEKGIIKIENRVNSFGEINNILVDMREELKEGNRGIFSETLKKEIESNIQNNEQTLLFLNRRGYSSFFLCRSCGETVKCQDCDVSLTYHKDREMLICHYCGFVRKALKQCPECSSTLIKDFGTGTQKVEEEIKSIFPDASVIRMDLDTTGYKDSHMKILDRFKEEGINVLIGTQMIAKGHDFPDITLAGIISAESLASDNSYNSNERAFQLIAQSIGRSGRGNKPGRAIIQAYNPDSYVINTAIKQDYMSFYEYETKLRKNLNYPPYGVMAKIIFSGMDSEQTKIWAEKAGRMLKMSGIEVSKAIYAPVSKIKNRFRYRLIAKDSDGERLHREINKLYLHVVRKFPKSLQCSIDIEGMNML